MIGIPTRSFLLACTLLSSFAMAFGDSASAQGDAISSPGTASPGNGEGPAIAKSMVPATMAMPGAMSPFPCPGCPPVINRNGGMAIINFVAPVTSKTMAELVRNAQNAVIGGADSIRINISSGGGSVYAMQFAVNVLKTLAVPIETVAMSQIASAAVALYCAGDTRYMANGAGLYLHQQTGYHEIQDKTAAAIVREYTLNKRWYDGILYACTHEHADHTMLDYSARDVVIDEDQATALGMTTGSIGDLAKGKIWGLAVNVTAPAPPHQMSYPPYR